MDKELTEEEKAVLQKITEAHTLFVALPGSTNASEWAEAIHKLQDLVGLRLLKRIHPEIYK